MTMMNEHDFEEFISHIKRLIDQNYISSEAGFAITFVMCVVAAGGDAWDTFLVNNIDQMDALNKTIQAIIKN